MGQKNDELTVDCPGDGHDTISISIAIELSILVRKS